MDPLNKSSLELEEFDSFNDSMGLLDNIIDRRKSQEKDELSLPALLDQSDDPYLNNQVNDSLPFAVTEELDNTVQKWMMEACHEGAFI